MAAQVLACNWFAPELLNGSAYTEKVDIWSVGILCHELVTGKPPFTNENAAQVAKNIIENDPPQID